MEALGYGIMAVINDVQTLEWNKYLTMELLNKYKRKLKWKWSKETHGDYGAHTS